jgi:hypothetical protein
MNEKYLCNVIFIDSNRNLLQYKETRKTVNLFDQEQKGHKNGLITSKSELFSQNNGENSGENSKKDPKKPSGGNSGFSGGNSGFSGGNSGFSGGNSGFSAVESKSKSKSKSKSNTKKLNKKSGEANVVALVEEVKVQENGWPSKPGENELGLELHPVKAGAVVELYKHVNQHDLTEKELGGLWTVFKKQNFTGERFYKSQNDVFSHFINWSKNQKINKHNGKSVIGTVGKTIEFD